MTRERVVITGLGPVTAIGCGRDAFWNAVLAGCDGAGEVQGFDTADYKVHRACEIAEGLLDALPAYRVADASLGRASRLAIAATGLALADAGLDAPPVETGVVIGTTGGEIQVLEDIDRVRHLWGDEAVDAAAFCHHPCHVISANTARHFGLSGPNLVVPTACAAGNYAVAIAREAIETGRADVMLAGGADPLSKVAFTGFARLGAIAPDRCRPFDRNRKGLLVGEGAGMVVLESLAFARRRGARCYAEVAGVGFSCDAHHMTMPHPEGRGVRLAMQRALSDAHVTPDALDYVSAHGTGTPANDRIEAAAVQAVLGARAASIPVSSIKSMVGHSMGAASAIETIACSLAIDSGMLPPTIHYETPDPACALDVVPNVPRSARVAFALNNAFAFGGNNGCLVLSELRA